MLVLPHKDCNLVSGQSRFPLEWSLFCFQMTNEKYDNDARGINKAHYHPSIFVVLVNFIDCCLQPHNYSVVAMASISPRKCFLLIGGCCLVSGDHHRGVSL